MRHFRKEHTPLKMVMQHPPFAVLELLPSRNVTAIPGLKEWIWECQTLNRFSCSIFWCALTLVQVQRYNLISQ